MTTAPNKFKFTAKQNATLTKLKAANLSAIQTSDRLTEAAIGVAGNSYDGAIREYLLHPTATIGELQQDIDEQINGSQPTNEPATSATGA